MALIKMVQSMTKLLQHPVEVFQQEIREHFHACGWRLVHRLECWLELDGAAVERGGKAGTSASNAGGGGGGGCFRDRELLEEIPQALAHSSPNKEEDLEDSGLSQSTTAGPGGSTGSNTALQQDLSQSSDCEGSGGASGGGAGDGSDSVATQGSGGASQSGGKASQESQPTVRPKKRRKSYRSFLPERSGYPDIGFPLFPLSKGFVKSMCGVLLQYRAALIAAGIPEHREDK